MGSNLINKFIFAYFLVVALKVESPQDSAECILLRKGSPGFDRRKGANGLPGPGRYPGNQGLSGPRGPSGFPGAPRIQSLPGKKGEPGKNGTRGPEGRKGEKGEKGKKGLQGVPGVAARACNCSSIKGEKGAVGRAGKSGSPGLPGPVGPPGRNCTDGGIRSKGGQGRPGTPGNPGNPGVPGTKGDKGDPGASSPSGHGVGVKGDKGDTGFPGIQGQPGRDGREGPPGPAGSLGTPSLLQFLPVPGPPGPPGPPGSPGINLTDGKEKPATKNNLTFTEIDDNRNQPGQGSGTNATQRSPECTRETAPCVVTFQNTDAMMKMSAVSQVGTLAYIIDEDALLVRFNNRWRYITLGSALPTTASPPPSDLFHASNRTNKIPLENNSTKPMSGYSPDGQLTLSRQ